MAEPSGSGVLGVLVGVVIVIAIVLLLLGGNMFRGGGGGTADVTIETPATPAPANPGPG